MPSAKVYMVDLAVQQKRLGLPNAEEITIKIRKKTVYMMVKVNSKYFESIGKTESQALENIKKIIP